MSAKYTKRMICLANSRKTSGRCVAGKELVDKQIGGWVRPISGTGSGEISEEDRRFKDGGDPKVLDVIHVPMKEPRPQGFQCENHLIDDGCYWTFERKATWEEVKAAVEEIEGPLWDNSSSSYNGVNDRVEETEAAKQDGSLCLVAVGDLSIKVSVEGAKFGNAKRKVRGRFSIDGEQYLLAITDPTIERQYLAGEDGTFDVGNAVLCISLGEVFEGYAYKLIAAVIIPPESTKATQKHK